MQDTLSNSTEIISIRQSHIISKHPVCNIIGFNCEINNFFSPISLRFILRLFVIPFQFYHFSNQNTSFMRDEWAPKLKTTEKEQKKMNGKKCVEVIMSILLVLPAMHTPSNIYIYIYSNISSESSKMANLFYCLISKSMHTRTHFSSTPFFFWLVLVVRFDARRLVLICRFDFVCHLKWCLCVLCVAFFALHSIK